ncbi:hypothetical protein BJ875DRAFT_485186 [Amylocarpus encephaloides]|uniref:N-terminal of MaoC-like dehydratase domain-containing protein n=1 Tax=Amylocarpus encephaloides TaxID=45428 RepID=A0A9P8C4A3_9HELO|nr:hypothetical protein BJ875DRAFT_485186 [Amylocarpus encephaloides]
MSIRRLLHGSSLRSPSNPSAASIASQFLATHASLPPHQGTRFLDPNSLQRFSAALSRSELALPEPPPQWTPLPPCYHLAYFLPAQVEEELGADGTDTMFNPPTPYTRRMWAGGELEWIHTGLKDIGDWRKRGLRVGTLVNEMTKLVSAEGKETKSGEEMVVVGVRKEYESQDDGLMLVDKRNWLFRPEITQPQNPVPKPTVVPFPDGKHVRDFLQTPVSLFRFSAVTFNAHKIHYNREWCREVEGHRDLVVHGPLNLVNMVNFWRDIHPKKELAIPRRVKYRATGPLYANEPYRLILDEEVDMVTKARFVDSYGSVAMVGQIEA